MTSCRILLKKLMISVFPFILLVILDSFAYGQWAIVSPPRLSTNWWVNGIYFTSPEEGWAVGGHESNQGVLLHYSGGQWTSVASPPVSASWYAYGVSFTSPEEGWAVGGDELNHTGVILHYSGGT